MHDQKFGADDCSIPIPIPRLHGVVELAVDLPDEELKSGAVGTIVDIYSSPDVAYEVEFSDDEGRIVAMLVLLPGQIRAG